MVFGIFNHYQMIINQTYLQKKKEFYNIREELNLSMHQMDRLLDHQEYGYKMNKYQDLL
jgi:hypothetical protein